MKTQLQHLQLDETIPGQVTVWIDVAGRSVNVLFEEVFAELEVLLAEMRCKEPPPILIFRSAKRKGFIVGADLNRILAMETDTEIQSFLLTGQAALEKLEAYPGNTIAVIQGPCLGGGLEFAMACRYRIASDAESTQLGMPEAKLGLMPGWGGTQRLIELVGYVHGLRMLLGGESIDAMQSLELQLVDKLFKDLSIDKDLLQFVGDVSRGTITKKRADRTDAETREFVAREFLNRKFSTPFPPSQSAIFQAVTIGMEESRAAGFRAERTLFHPLLMSPAVRDGLQRFAPQPKK